MPGESKTMSTANDIQEKVSATIQAALAATNPKTAAAYQKLSIELADYLTSRNPSANILVVIDGLAAAGKSTLTAYLLQALHDGGRPLGNWLELDGFLKSPRQRRRLWNQMAERMRQDTPAFTNQHQDNYQTDSIAAFFEELKAMIEKNKTPGEVEKFKVSGVHRYSGEPMPMAYVHDRDTLIDHEYCAYFAAPLHNLHPTYIRVVKDIDEAKHSFLERTKIAYGLDNDVNDGSDFMHKREILFQSDVATYNHLAKRTDSLVNIEVHLSGKPNYWKTIFRN